MARYDYDLFVIGGGSGGVRAARVAGDHGARVAIAEEDRYGGTCVIRGCIPKKFLSYASGMSGIFADAPAYGWHPGEARLEWPALIAGVNERIERLSSTYNRLLGNAGCTIFTGRARLADAHTVELEGRRVTAHTILVATGSRPVRPPIPGIEHAITSDDAFRLPELPRRAAIVGGGYIAVEFASIFHGLGCEVSLVHRRDRVLRGFDDDVRESLTGALLATDMRLRLDNEIERIDRTDPGALRLTLADGDPLEVDLVLSATGRAPNTRGIGLEELGVELGEHGAVRVDRTSRSTAGHIYAVGDCTDRVNLTPVAIHEGQAFADTVFGGQRRLVDHEAVPSAVFSHPPVGSVGLSEDEANTRYETVDIYESRFRPLYHSMTRRPIKTMMKLVVDGASQRVVGAHMVGDDAPEIIQGIAIAVKMGATKADFDATLAVHPTSAEEFVLMRRKRPNL